MYSYDKPLVDVVAFASVNFATQTPVTLPCAAIAAMAHDGIRSLDAATILGLSGVVTTAGTGVISIGDGTDADRYGVITLDATVTTGKAARGTVVLTEDGFRMGVADGTVADTFVLTFSGSAVVASVSVAIGRY